MRIPGRLILLLLALASLTAAQGAIEDALDPDSEPSGDLQVQEAEAVLATARAAQEGVLPALREAISANLGVRNLDRAQTLSLEMLESADSESVFGGYANRFLGEVAMFRDQHDLALEYFAISAAVFEALNDETGQAYALWRLGQAHRYKAEYVTALRHLRQALDIHTRQEDAQGRAHVENTIGVVLEKIGLYEEALDAYGRAMELSRELDDIEGVATGLYNIGVVYREIGDTASARTYLTDALAMDEASGDPSNVAHSYMQLAGLEQDADSYSVAHEYAEKARDLFVVSQSPRNVAWAEHRLGQIELARENLDVARTWLESSLSACTQLNARSLEPEVRGSMARLALAEGNPLGALEHLAAGLALARDIQERDIAANLLEIQARAFLAAGQTEDALSAMTERLELQRINYQDSRAAALAEFQASAENQRQLQEIELLRTRQALEDAQSAREDARRNAVLLIAGLILASVLLIGLRMYQLRTQRRLQSMVNERTEELNRRNDELSGLNRKLEKLGRTDPLTGLANRRAVASALPSMLAIPGAFTLFLLDLDRFKRINDDLGHHVGDAVLKECAVRLKQIADSEDMVARWGGEEFLIIRKSGGSPEAFAESIRANFAASTWNGVDRVTTSIGFVSFPLMPEHHSEGDFEKALSLADSCLYKAKENGRDGWVGIRRREPSDPEVGGEALKLIADFLDPVHLHLVMSRE